MLKTFMSEENAWFKLKMKKKIQNSKFAWNWNKKEGGFVVHVQFARLLFACWNGKEERTSSNDFLPFTSTEHQQSQRPHANIKPDFGSFTAENDRNHTLHYITISQLINHGAMHHNA